jgi:hypothetical protein
MALDSLKWTEKRGNIVACYTHCLEMRLAVISKLPGFGESCIRFIVTTEQLESKTFAQPGFSIVWLQLNSLIKSLNGIIVLALISESIAFVAPGRDIVGIQLNDFVIQDSKKK